MPKSDYCSDPIRNPFHVTHSSDNQNTSTSPVTPSLSQHAARGMVWMSGKTLLAKVATIAGHFILAWLLLEDDFGLYAMTLTVMGFGSLIETAGLRDVLVHRHLNFRRWANPAFWMAESAGLVSMVFMLAAAPVVAYVYDEPRVIWMIVILALAAPLNSLSIVPRAAMQSQLRFRGLAAIEFTSGVGLIAVTILFALLGFGAYSFVLSRPIMYVGRAVALFTAARPRILWRPQLRRWKFLYGDSGVVLLSAFVAMAILQGDFILLSVLYHPDIVGLYFIAFMFSRQIVSLLGTNLAMVLLPSLSKLQHDPVRLVNAYLRGMRLLAFLTVPGCILMASIAGPLVRLTLPERLELAIPAMSVLLVGSSFHSLSATISSMLRAMGRFRVELALTVVRAVLFFACIISGVFIGALIGERTGVHHAGMIGVAVGSSVAYIVTTVIDFAVATKPGGGDAMTVWRLARFPVVVSAVGAGAGLSAAWLIPVTGMAGMATDVIVISFVFGVICLGAAWLFERRTMMEIIEMAGRVVRIPRKTRPIERGDADTERPPEVPPQGPERPPELPDADYDAHGVNRDL